MDLMPWPAHVQLHEGRLALTRQFDVTVTGDPGQRVYDAATRLLQRLQRRSGIGFDQHLVTANSGGKQTKLVIHVRRSGVLRIGEDESYSLHIDSDHAVLTAEDGLGALHGLQTLRQLL